MFAILRSSWTIRPWSRTRARAALLPGSQDAIADPAAMTWAEVPGRLAPARTYWLGGAPKRRTSPLPPHRRQVPQRRLLLPAFFLLPLHDGQRRIGWRCMSTHQATT